MNKVNWHSLYDSTLLENQVKYNIACACEGYINGCVDCDYPALSKEEWRNYIYDVMQDTFETKYGTDMGTDAARHLRFYGKKKTYALIDWYLDNYPDVKPYIKG